MVVFSELVWSRTQVASEKTALSRKKSIEGDAKLGRSIVSGEKERGGRLPSKQEATPAAWGQWERASPL